MKKFKTVSKDNMENELVDTIEDCSIEELNKLLDKVVVEEGEFEL